MADTQRTRAAILSLFADNVTGQISAQDLRDFVVTVMPEEFINEVDFWVEPSPTYVDDQDEAKGWFEYNQTIHSGCSHGEVMQYCSEEVWRPAGVSTYSINGCLGIAMDTHISGDTNVTILRKGLIYYSEMSGDFAGQQGRPVFLHSVSGMISGATCDAVTSLVIGTIVSDTKGKWYFDPPWCIVSQS